jgi:hypothetical protein
MGLDVYVGSLTRYYARAWETVVQKAGREQGIAVQIVRDRPASPDPVTEPQQINEAVLMWRGAIAKALSDGGAISGGLDWAEGVDVPYFTDKPGWTCFGALLLLAAYEEDKPRFGDRWPKRVEAGWERDGRLTRRVKARGSRYSHMFGCEAWIPTDLAHEFEAMMPNGHASRIGSSIQLQRELLELNERTYRGTQEDLASWSQMPPGPEDLTFELNSKTGLAILLALTALAVEHRLPMILDY